MEMSSSVEADSRWASQEMLFVLLNPKIYRRANKNQILEYRVYSFEQQK
jgi:hypothetical protein